MPQHIQKLILSGIHGDEYGVISSVQKYLDSHDVPDYLYIPEVSPSAVKLKTRRNVRNLDLNRSFLSNVSEPEIEDLKLRLKDFSFKYMFSFHEDWGLENETYIYSSHFINQSIWMKFSTKLSGIGIELFNGIDDPDDPKLGNKIENGLIITPVETELEGSIWPWLKLNNNVKYFIDFEIPMKASQEKKDKTVELIFEILIKNYNELFL